MGFVVRVQNMYGDSLWLKEQPKNRRVKLFEVINRLGAGIFATEEEAVRRVGELLPKVIARGQPGVKFYIEPADFEYKGETPYPSIGVLV